jgi:hypothetical protein
MSAVSMSSQARSHAIREAKAARDREGRKVKQYEQSALFILFTNRADWKQYKPSMLEWNYARLQDAAAKDLQVHTISSQHHATSA